MANTKPEKQVQSDIMKYVKDYGHYCIKVMKANENGVSDLLMCVDGKFIACEVKAERFINDPYKQASPWQLLQIRKVKNAGGLAVVVASLKQFQDLLGYLVEEL